MKKKNIVTAITTGAVGSVVAVGAIAQECSPTNEQVIIVERVVAVETAIRNLDGITTAPSNDNEFTVFNALSTQLRSLSGNDTLIIKLITIKNPEVTVNSNNQGSVAYIDQNSLQIIAGDAGNTTNDMIYTNINATVEFLDIAFTNNEISEVGFIDGIRQSTEGEVIVNSLSTLNGATTPPASGTNEREIWNAIQTAIRSFDTQTASAAVTSLVIDDFVNNVSFDASSNTITIQRNALSVTVIYTSGSSTENLFRNLNSNLEIAITSFSSGIINSIASITGFVTETYNSAIIVDIIESMNVLDFAPPANTSQGIIWFAFQDAIREVPDSDGGNRNAGAILTNVLITSETPIASDGSNATITEGDLQLHVINADYNQFTNEEMLTISNIVLTGENISSVGNIGPIVKTFNLEEDLIFRDTLRRLSNATMPPTIVGDLIVWNGLQAHIQSTANNENAVIQSIFITNPLTTILPGGNDVAVSEGAILITTTNGQENLWTNSDMAFDINGLSFNGREIDGIGSVVGLTGFQSLSNSQLVNRALIRLGGYVREDNSNLDTLETQIFNALTSEVQINAPGVEIETLSFTAPTAAMITENAGVITIPSIAVQGTDSLGGTISGTISIGLTESGGVFTVGMITGLVHVLPNVIAAILNTTTGVNVLVSYTIPTDVMAPVTPPFGSIAASLFSQINHLAQEQNTNDEVTGSLTITSSTMTAITTENISLVDGEYQITIPAGAITDLTMGLAAVASENTGSFTITGNVTFTIDMNGTVSPPTGLMYISN